MLNVSQTMVALMTNAAHHEHASDVQLREVAGLLEGATRFELLAVLVSMSNVSNYALDLLEEHSALTKDQFLRELGQFFMENPEE